MTRLTTIALTALFGLTILAAPMQAAEPSAKSVAPPAKPAGLTAEQFSYIQQLESQPEQVAVQDITASYASDKEAEMEAVRWTDDILTGLYQFGYPAAYAIVLLAAI